MPEPPPTYTREEMDAILKRAIERQQAKAEEIAHEDLVAAAGEVGIPREDVEAAARDLAAEKAKGIRDKVPLSPPPASPPPSTQDTATVRRESASAWMNRRAVSYFLACMVFGLVGRQFHATWVVWPILALTLSFLVQASYFFRGKDPRDATEERAERRSSRRERRRARREEKLADFERKVQIGADAIARVIEEARKAKSRIDERTPERERGPRVIVTPPPGVRVEPHGEAVASAEDDRDASPARRARRQ